MRNHIQNIVSAVVILTKSTQSQAELTEDGFQAYMYFTHPPPSSPKQIPNILLRTQPAQPRVQRGRKHPGVHTRCHCGHVGQDSRIWVMGVWNRGPPAQRGSFEPDGGREGITQPAPWELASPFLGQSSPDSPTCLVLPADEGAVWGHREETSSSGKA